MKSVIVPLLLVLGPVVFGIGLLSIRLVKRLLAVDGEKLLEKDTRPPILFLRAFEDDAAGLKLRRDPNNWRHQLMPMNTGTREEQALERMFRSVGPCVTARVPDKALPETGAARIRLSVSEWQTEVLNLVDRSRYVVVRISTSPNLIWEIQELCKRDPQKLILYTGGAQQDERWQKFCDEAENFFPKGLPSKLEGAQYVLFADDWSPLLRPNSVPDRISTFSLAFFLAPAVLPFAIVSVVSGNVWMRVGVAAIGLWHIYKGRKARSLPVYILGAGLFLPPITSFFVDFERVFGREVLEEGLGAVFLVAGIVLCAWIYSDFRYKSSANYLRQAVIGADFDNRKT